MEEKKPNVIIIGGGDISIKLPEPKPMIPLSEALKFAEWCSGNGWTIACINKANKVYWWINEKSIDDLGLKTTSDLYNLYKEGK